MVFWVVEPSGRDGIFERAKHGGIVATVTVYNSVLVEILHVVAVVGENPAGGVGGFVEGVSEVIIVVVGLGYGVIDVSVFDLDPSDSVGILTEEIRETNTDEWQLYKVPVGVCGVGGRVNVGGVFVGGDGNRGVVDEVSLGGIGFVARD